MAIFVYRVGFGGEGARTYTVSAHTSNANSNAWPNESPLPARVDLAVVDRWLPTGVDDTSRLDDHVVPATAPSGAVLGPHLDPYELGWQYPGQWILDQNGNVHRVFKGRRSFADGPVQLAQPVPYIPQQAASGNLFDDSGNLIDDPATASAVKSIWFIPPATGTGVFLTPIFVMVRDL